MRHPNVGCSTHVPLALPPIYFPSSEAFLLRRGCHAEATVQCEYVHPGSPHQKSKIVRLGLLRKPIAFRNPIAIRICNAKYGAFLQVEDRCSNLGFRNSPYLITVREAVFVHVDWICKHWPTYQELSGCVQPRTKSPVDRRWSCSAEVRRECIPGRCPGLTSFRPSGTSASGFQARVGGGVAIGSQLVE
jgi:hypothetical protein